MKFKRPSYRSYERCERACLGGGGAVDGSSTGAERWRLEEVLQATTRCAGAVKDARQRLGAGAGDESHAGQQG